MIQRHMLDHMLAIHELNVAITTIAQAYGPCLGRKGSAESVGGSASARQRMRRAATPLARGRLGRINQASDMLRDPLRGEALDYRNLLGERAA